MKRKSIRCKRKIKILERSLAASLIFMTYDLNPTFDRVIKFNIKWSVQGQNISNLEPNFINPASPLNNTTTFFCIINYSACYGSSYLPVKNFTEKTLLLITMVVLSLSSDDFGCHATKYLPGWYLLNFILPLTQYRVT